MTRSLRKSLILWLLLPTALAASGAEAQPEWKLDGENLLPYVTGEQSGPPHEALYWRFGQQVAIRMGDWKLVKGAGMEGVKVEANEKANMDGAELYNLSQDIGEKTNLAAKEPEKVKQLTATWNQWNSELMNPQWVPNRKAAAGGKKGGKGKKKAAGQ